MQRRTFLATAGAAAATGLAGCTALQIGGTQGDIEMRPVSFSPTEFTASVGDTVTWYNASSRSHTVTAYEQGIPQDADYFASGGFESEQAARKAWTDNLAGKVESGQTFEHTFEVAGRYEYVCIPHEQGGMRGRVVVEK